MRLDEILACIRKTGQHVMGTADVMALLNINKDHASHALCRLAESGHVARLKRGVWLVSENRDPFLLAEYLTAPFPAYISLHTALYHHGMVSQMPSAIYCMSPARSRTYDTPLGRYSVHHVAESFFFGFEPLGNTQIKMASPEKALLDILYLSGTKTRLFAALPEVDLAGRFDPAKAKHILARIPSKQRRTLVESRLCHLLEKPAH